MHQCEDLIALFNACFLEKYNTRLVKGGEEPLYLPADTSRAHNELFFAHGFLLVRYMKVLTGLSLDLNVVYKWILAIGMNLMGALQNNRPYSKA
jgi:Uncharacterized protein conserved in bacteria